MNEQLAILENVLCALIDPYKSTKEECLAAANGHAAIKQIRTLLEHQDNRENTLIEYLQVSTRIKNALASAGLRTIRQVLCYKGDFRCLRNFSKVSYDELMQSIQKHLSQPQGAAAI